MYPRRDVLALGILITDLLKESEEEEEAVLFREFARDQMLLPDSSRRPDLLTGKEATKIRGNVNDLLP